MGGKYRVWHIPQIPGKPFEVYSNTLEEALRVQEILADYDLFQFEHHIKPDYSNASGILEWNEEEREWEDVDVEWELENAGAE